MITEKLIGILLLIPVIIILIPSVKFFKESRKAREMENAGTGSDRKGKVAAYNKPLWIMLGIGYFAMWVLWIGNIALLLFTDYGELAAGWTFSPANPAAVQTIGLIVFLSGAAVYIVHLFVAGKYIQPSHSGTLSNHKLVDKGTFALVRHPLYVCYVLISAGLGITLMSLLYMIPTALVLAGIYPTAKAEEEVLLEQLGDDYADYRKRVGMFFPKLF